MSRECEHNNAVVAEEVERAEGNVGPISVECQKDVLLFLAKFSHLGDKRGCPLEETVRAHAVRVSERIKGVPA